MTTISSHVTISSVYSKSLQMGQSPFDRSCKLNWSRTGEHRCQARPNEVMHVTLTSRDLVTVLWAAKGQDKGVQLNYGDEYVFIFSPCLSSHYLC